MAKFAISGRKTPQPIFTKFETRDYVADIFFQKTIWPQYS